MKGCKSQLLAVSPCTPLATQTVEPEPCASMRFADIGWTDIAMTIATTRQVLESLGYKTKVNLLPVPMTYRSLVNNDLDIFLGNWISTMTNDIKQYAKKDTIGTLHASLEGAKYTLAAPQYVYDGGLYSFTDIAKLSDKLGNKIYGIELGNDGSHVAQNMIDRNAFKLGKFKLVGSSRAGMLSQVQRVIRCNQWVVFLGWEPHPTSTHFQMEYLEGGDDFSSPNYGGATIYTNVCRGHAQECANIGQSLKNLSFTFETEDKPMDAVLNKNKKPEGAARAWLKDHPEQLDAWLAGIITRDGRSVAAVARLAFVE